MKSIINIYSIALFVLLSNPCFAQMTNIEGYWNSSSGNRFFVMSTSSGLLYQDLRTGRTFEALFEGNDLYTIDIYKNGWLADVLMISVMDRNTIDISYAFSSRTNRWKRSNKYRKPKRKTVSSRRSSSNNRYKIQQLQLEIQSLRQKIKNTQQDLNFYRGGGGSDLATIQTFQNLINQHENWIWQYQNRIDQLR